MSATKLTRRGFAGAASSFFAASYLAPFRRILGNENAPKSKSTATSSRGDIYVVDLSRSKYARLHPLPLRAITIRDGFWAQRIAVNRNSAISEVYQQEIQNGRVFNFQRMHQVEHDRLSTDLHSLRPGADSEVYKWIEGASWALATPDPQLQMRVSQIVKDVVDAQEPSGYLDTYFVGGRLPQRMLPETQVVGHEVYSMGHLIQAGIALYRVTGDRALLDAGLNFVNGYLLAGFGPEPDKLPLMSGHPGPEMMIVELYRETGDTKYLQLAAYLLQGDRRIPVRADQASYTFAGRPFSSRTVMEGHAVRAVYACCGAADYAIESGDPGYLKALNLLWEDMTQRQMYITGGIGATVHNEAFGGDYALPNKGSYCESCANIGVFQWAYRMLALTGQATYGDVLERTLYNSVNSGMSLDGLSFNYRNPLYYSPDTDPKVRRPFWYVNCCAPNLNRTLSSLQSYFYSLSNEGLFVHLYDNSKVECNLADGTLLEVKQATTYPWGGNIDFELEPAKSIEFTLFLRIPAWAGSSSVTVNGAPVELVTPGKYLPIRRTWSRGDRVRLNLDMTPHLIVADPNIEAARGRVAVQRGPLVYCMESIDQSKAASLDNYLLQLDTAGSPEFNEQFDHQLLGGVVSINMRGVLDETRVPTEQKTTYSAMKTADGSTPKTVTLKLIPYYTFANRQESAMQVWLSYTRA
jgi:uncharacterized protein